MTARKNPMMISSSRIMTSLDPFATPAASSCHPALEKITDIFLKHMRNIKDKDKDEYILKSE